MNKITVVELMHIWANKAYYGTTPGFQEFMQLTLAKMKNMEEDIEALKRQRK